MRRPWIKVCGITREEDAHAALECGARALGFILHPESPRYIEPARAKKIIESLPEPVAKVAVTVNAPPELVSDLKLECGFTALQAHGEESPDICSQYPLPVVKAVRCTPDLETFDLTPYASWPILLDGFRPGAHGGTGRLADWDLARRLKRDGSRVLLAGGLGPDNALQAIETVAPDALDFNTLVESEPGVKDHRKLQALRTVLGPLEEPARESWPW